MGKTLCGTVLLLTQAFIGVYGDIIPLQPVVSVHEGDLKTSCILGAEISKPTSLKMPKTELVKSEANVPLQCSIQNELVSEHRLYWFKHGSGESPPGFIYVQGNTSDGCVRSSEAGCLSPTCEYSLPEKTFSPSQTGVYCALASCGEALFGNASKHNPDNVNILNTRLLFAIVLTVLLISNITINILLCCMRISESVNATQSKYKQIRITDDDVTIIEYEEKEEKFWPSPIIAKYLKSQRNTSVKEI
ncbi:uncharacterized protein LOC122347892 [Puntigrus tetrazona]|uniref:uncharacterized protein LOC122347892 n=1 Tax=Puntigrus tetrazona TaxID=1606681 RepID=UPI001C8A5AFE|nr:uncharacterized protein LOC122347892 [Puntigrus tetrazona]